MSTFTVEVVDIKKELHPNADRLSIVHVHGWQVVTRSDDWKDGDLAAYIPPDSMVPDQEQYAFLASHPELGLREKDRLLEGISSQSGTDGDR